MPQFSYSGRDSGGTLVTGLIEAVNQNGAADQLLSNNIIPVKIELTEGASEDPLKLIQEKYFSPRVTLDDLAMFSRQMYSLMRAGVVVNKAVKGLAQSARNVTLQRALFDVEKSLNQGVALAVSMRQHSAIFGDLFINIVHVGENSGRLDMAFYQMAQYLNREKETRRSISTAMRYPSFVIIAISAALVILNIWVIPVFAEMFSKFNAQLPLPTRILVGTSHFFQTQWPLMLALGVGSYFALRYYINTDEGRYRWDKLKLRIPIIGSILKRAMLARYARTFSLMLKSGVPLIQALELCSRAVGNEYLRFKIRDMRQGVERGESLLRISTTSGMFTPLVLQMVAVGEETGQVDELLEEVATFYDDEVDYELQGLSAKIEPLLIVCIAAIVAVLALGIFLPMWDMMNVMQGK
jgi:MSHA biogenesis protein MshG